MVDLLFVLEPLGAVIYPIRDASLLMGTTPKSLSAILETLPDGYFVSQKSRLLSIWIGRPHIANTEWQDDVMDLKFLLKSNKNRLDKV